MPLFTVTGATGQFGNLVIESLLRLGAPPKEIRASVREVAKAVHHQTRGMDVRRGDFDDPGALRGAFENTRRLLIISTDQVGARVEQHRRAVEAAREAGVEYLEYTSVVNMQGGESTSPIASDHRATEAIIRDSGIPYTILRNTFYAEYMLAPLVQSLGSGEYVSSAGDGRLGAAARTDLADAAALVLSELGHENKTYELTFPRAWDFREAADLVSRVSGRTLVYRPVSDEEYTRFLVESGVPEEAAQASVAMSQSLRAGDLALATRELEEVLRRPVTSLEEVTRRLLNR